MNPPRFLRTSSFRLIVIYASFFAASSLLIFGVQYWLISGTLRQQAVELADSELAGLEKGLQKGTFTDLRKEVGKRAASAKYPVSYYLLQDAEGRKLAGNIPSLEPFKGWMEVPVPSPEVTYGGDAPDNIDQYTAFAKGKFLPDGRFLAVGYSSYQIDNPLEIIREFFFSSVALIIFLAFSGGAAVSIGFLRRVDSINHTVETIVDGNLAERIPTSGVGDELDTLAANVNRMLDRIQVLLESLRQVSSNIAHDLRTPLGRMRQRLATAKESAVNISEYEGAVESAMQDIDAILSTFGSLLRIANIEAKSRNSSFRRIDLSDAFRSVAEAYQPVAEDMDKRLEMSVSDDIFVQGDRDLLVQMLANLVENAITHTPPRTTIRLCLDHTSQGPVGTLSDDGPGIPKREHEKIFERFYRIDSGRTSPGNGLGLALVKAIAELHGVPISLADKDPGVEFSIHFGADVHD